jgi:hypothetical protein
MSQTQPEIESNREQCKALFEKEFYSKLEIKKKV